MKKKILFLQHSPNLGGAPKSLYQLASLARNNGFEYSIWVMGSGRNRKLFDCLDGTITYTEKSYIFHASVVSPYGVRNAVRNILSIFVSFFVAVKIALTEKNVDLIYLNSSSLCFYGLFLRVFLRKRLICHLREPLRRTLAGRIVRFVTGLSVDEFVAISEQEAHQFRKSNVTVAPNYLDTKLFSSGNSPKFTNFKPKEFEVNIGYFGRLTEENGILLIAELGELIKTAELAYKFHIHVFGISGNESEKVKSILLRAPPSLSLYPITENIEQYMGECDIIVVPFVTPHFSRAQIEGMTLGKVVIASNIDPLNKYIKNNVNGILVSETDAQSWFDIICKVSKTKAIMARISKNAEEQMSMLASESKTRILEVLSRG